MESHAFRFLPGRHTTHRSFYNPELFPDFLTHTSELSDLSFFIFFGISVDQLMDVLLPLLEELSHQKDVRPMLYEKFHMPEWFQKQGIPSKCWTSVEGGWND